MKIKPEFAAVLVWATVGSILSTQPVAAAPCPTDMQYLAGEWAASSKDEVVADAKWEAPAGGCVVLETWSPRSATQARFFALLAYDARKNNWSYLGTTSRGELEFYPTGALKGDELQLVRTDEDKTMHRFSFIKQSADSVRILFLRSTDGDKTWATDFDASAKKKT